MLPYSIKLASQNAIQIFMLSFDVSLDTMRKPTIIYSVKTFLVLKKSLHDEKVLLSTKNLR